jgi:hypothetical protein
MLRHTVSLLWLTKRDANVNVLCMTNARDEEPEPYLIPLSLDGREVLSFEPREFSGWAAYFSDEVQRSGAYVFFRFGPRRDEPDGRRRLLADGAPIEILEMQVVAKTWGTRDLGSTLLRTIPWDRIQAAVNQPAHRETLARLLPPANLIMDSPPGKSVAWTLRPQHPVELPPPQPRLDIIPQGYRKPDDFYRQVAERFLQLATISGRPAQELAEANGVKPTTVHRWIREAKDRGLLALPWDRKTPRSPNPSNSSAPPNPEKEG